MRFSSSPSETGNSFRTPHTAPQTPLDRLLASHDGDRAALAALQAQRARTDLFDLADRVQRHLARLWHLPPRPATPPASASPITNVETETLQLLGRLFGTTAYVRGRAGRLVSVGQGTNS